MRKQQKQDKNYCALYIIRHGETVMNVERRLQGTCDSPLTKTGFQQAKKVARELIKIKFSAAFSSDLIRAKKTAEVIALEHDLVVTTTKLLRERHFGEFEGATITKYQKDLKDLLAKRETLSHQERFSFKLTNDIESDEEIVSRFITFLRETALAYLGKNVLVVSHGSMMKILLIHLGRFSYQEYASFGIGNAAYIVLQSDGIDFFIKELKGVEKR